MKQKILLCGVILLMSCLSYAQGIHKITGLDLFIAANNGADFIKFDSEMAEEILTGKKIDLANLSNKSLSQPGKPTLIIIWASPSFTNCPPCNLYKDALFNSKIDTAFNVVTIAIVSDKEPTKQQKEFMEAVKKDKRFYNLKIQKSSGGTIASIPVIPYTYLLNVQDKMIYKYEGYEENVFSKLLYFKNRTLGYQYQYLKDGLFVNLLEESDNYIEIKNEDGTFIIEKYDSNTKKLISQKYFRKIKENEIGLLAYFEYDDKGNLIIKGNGLVQTKGYIFYQEKEYGDWDTKTKSRSEYYKTYVYLLVDGLINKRAEVERQLNDSLVLFKGDGHIGLLNGYSHEIILPAQYDEIILLGGDLFIVSKFNSDGNVLSPYKSSIIDKNQKEIIPGFYGRLKLLKNHIVKEKVESIYKNSTFELLDRYGKFLGSYDNVDSLNAAIKESDKE